MFNAEGITRHANALAEKWQYWDFNLKPSLFRVHRLSKGLQAVQKMMYFNEFLGLKASGIKYYSISSINPTQE